MTSTGCKRSMVFAAAEIAELQRFFEFTYLHLDHKKKRERKTELLNLKTFGQFKALTQPGLDFDERQYKETQPHASPPHGGHGALLVCRPSSSLRLLLTSLYRDAALFFPTSHPLSVMKTMMFYCRDMC